MGHPVMGLTIVPDPSAPCDAIVGAPLEVRTLCQIPFDFKMWDRTIRQRF
jgi:hypothetical protein